MSVARRDPGSEPASRPARLKRSKAAAHLLDPRPKPGGRTGRLTTEPGERIVAENPDYIRVRHSKVEIRVNEARLREREPVNLGQRPTHGLCLFHIVAQWTVRNVLEDEKVLPGCQHLRRTNELPRPTQESRLDGQCKRVAAVNTQHPIRTDPYIEVREATREKLDRLGHLSHSTLDLRAVERTCAALPLPQALGVPQSRHGIIIVAQRA